MKQRHPGIPWSRIVAFRNIAVHAYFAINWHVVWEAAINDAPELKEKVAKIIDWDHPEMDEE